MSVFFIGIIAAIVFMLIGYISIEAKRPYLTIGSICCTGIILCLTAYYFNDARQAEKLAEANFNLTLTDAEIKKINRLTEALGGHDRYLQYLTIQKQ